MGRGSAQVLINIKNKRKIAIVRTWDFRYVGVTGDMGLSGRGRRN